jgi:chorismate mutase
MVCAREIPVKGSLPLCVRVLIHWNTKNAQNEINHIYLRGAINLRPDLSK